jgi:hypothetical protein
MPAMSLGYSGLNSCARTWIRQPVHEDKVVEAAGGYRPLVLAEAVALWLNSGRESENQRQPEKCLTHF